MAVFVNACSNTVFVGQGVYVWGARAWELRDCCIIFQTKEACFFPREAEEEEEEAEEEQQQ